MTGVGLEKEEGGPRERERASASSSGLKVVQKNAQRPPETNNLSLSQKWSGIKRKMGELEQDGSYATTITIS